MERRTTLQAFLRLRILSHHLTRLRLLYLLNLRHLLRRQPPSSRNHQQYPRPSFQKNHNRLKNSQRSRRSHRQSKLSTTPTHILKRPRLRSKLRRHKIYLNLISGARQIVREQQRHTPETNRNAWTKLLSTRAQSRTSRMMRLRNCCTFLMRQPVGTRRLSSHKDCCKRKEKGEGYCTASSNQARCYICSQRRPQSRLSFLKKMLECRT